MNTSDANATQVGGSHYRNDIQHWDFVAQYGLGYFEGQVTKYVTRWRKKNGVQDLRKAQHFLRKLIELVSNEGYAKEPSAKVDHEPDFKVATYLAANGLDDDESLVIISLAWWVKTGQHDFLLGAACALDALLKLAELEEAAAASPGRNYVDQG